MTPSRSQIAAWKPTALRDVADRITSQNGVYRDCVHHMRSRVQDAGGDWSGAAYDAAYERTCSDCDRGSRIADEVDALAQVLVSAAADLDSYLNVLRSKANDAEVAGCIISEDWSMTGTDSEVHAPLVSSALRALEDSAAQNEQHIREASTRVRDRGNELPDWEAPSTQQSDRVEQTRDEASADAFHDMFGRYPVTPSDWSTAEVLNPNSYTEKYAGVPPGIQVALIEPVPGQGVVRTSSYIEQGSVYNVPWDDLGDNRTDNADFDPENSRVTVYVDYENGIVVMRQNPSVDENGSVRVDEPHGEVWQNSDGSVRLSYEAANPFRPSVMGVEPPGALMPAVNGDVVFTPGQGTPGAPDSTGVTINGIRDDYPSFEAYQDSPDGITHTIVVDPAASGDSTAPMTNLIKSHDIGSGDSALEQFQEIRVHGGMVPPTMADRPGVALGSAADPPRVS
ncbi:WXG100 family type VII secretion target [Rhodococcus triatomae]|nr:hypothetical protein G419_05507 [Rhodococcus triatomae BKS 15-14]